MATDYRAFHDLSGKTAIVTGGAGILGREFCLGLAQHGARVIVADLDAAAADKVAAEIGGQARGIACDVADPDSVADLVAQAGTVDILFNNAAGKSDDLGAFFAPFEEYSLAQWRRVMAVNLDGMFLMAQAAGRQMLRQKSGGSIVQTASIYGLLASDQRIYEGSDYLGGPINNPAVYAASKAGVIGLTRWLAAYWAKDGIRVNALAPGGVESGQNETFQARYGARVPMGRMARREEIVGAALFLASDAASYVTGQCLAVDGGLSAW